MDSQRIELETLNSLVAAVEKMMDHSTSQKERMQAYELCELFKENCSNCAEYGFVLVEKERSHIIRHFGLQLVEYSVRYKWINMSGEQKLFIKDNTLKLMAQGTFSILGEQTHIKDGLSRIMVEIIKREWPQQYPDMFDEFHNLCSVGPTQTELVLLIFLRLAEDVLLFQTVPTQRRRDILSGLSLHMASIYRFFTVTLQDNYNTYQSLKSATGTEERNLMMASCKVCQAVLEALAAYLDWMNVSYVFQDSGRILQQLCGLLNDSNLQLPAAECLIIIANRRGKIEDRKPLLILFSEGAMGAIFTAAVAAAQADLEEYHYLFLKKLCQVLVALGTQLAALWGLNIDGQEIGQPETFSNFLDAILSFTQHASQSLGSITISMWTLFLKHEHITKNPVFRDVYIPKLLQTTRTSMLKVGYPSQDNSRSCEYSRLDFDSDSDFVQFYTKYRTEVAEMVRLATLISPCVAFYFVENWLNEQLKKPIDRGRNCDKEYCNLSSPSYLELEALALCLECVIQKINPSPATEKPPVDKGIAMFAAVLEYTTQDPLILSGVLSCISALFPFLRHIPDILTTILDKIFAAVVFNIQGQTKVTRIKAVRNVRRHACSVLVKVCKEYPEMLAPGYSQLYMYIKKLSEDPDELSQMEKTTLLEAIVLISNEFKNYDEQVKCLGEILQHVKDIWFAEPLKEALWSADKFFPFVGLDKPGVDFNTIDPCGVNRSQILYCVNVIYGTMKRSTWPSDPAVARQGGFEVQGSVPDKAVMFRSAAASHVLLMMENVLALCRTLNQIWLPEYQQKRHTDFSKAYDIMDLERDAILGIHHSCVDNSDSTVDKTPLQRMQNFYNVLHDTCYHILGTAGRTFGVEFYRAPNMATVLAQTVFTHLSVIPDHKLKVIIRAFLKLFVQNCPQDYYISVLLPTFQTFAPYMLEHLTSKWQVISQQIEKSDDDSEPEVEEVLQEQLLRQMSREYLELIGLIFKERRAYSNNEATENAESQPLEEQSQNSQSSQNSQPSRDLTLGELGKLVLQSEAVFPPLVMTVFSGVTWPDSFICNKCVALCFPLLQQLVSDNKLTSDDVSHMYTSVLQGLHVHGQHEGQQAMLLSLGLQVYEFLRPRFAEVRQVMLQVPGCTENGLQNFDEKIVNANPNKQVPEKRKKDMYRKLVQGIIGKNVGQKFKKEMHIRNLPPLMKASKPKPLPLTDPETNDLGLCALFVPDLEQM